MKRFKMLGLAFVAAVAVSLAPSAQAAVSAPNAVTSFSQTSTDIGVTNSWAIISANGVGTPRVEYVSVTSDKAGSQLLFYTPSAGVQLTLATNASQAVVWAVGTSFTANDKVVLRHVTTDTYERLVVSSSTSTNVTFTGNLGTAVVAGDLIYKMTTGAAIPVGNATVSIVSTGGAFYNGNEGLPIYVEIDGTAASQINLISGSYDNFRSRRSY
jgi:hypothetical protein